MKLVLSPEAASQFEQQIVYVRDEFSPRAANRLSDRVLGFLTDHLQNFPRAGHELGVNSLWEIWIPRTKIIVWYRLSGDEIQLVAVWNTSQNRELHGQQK